MDMKDKIEKLKTKTGITIIKKSQQVKKVDLVLGQNQLIAYMLKEEEYLFPISTQAKLVESEIQETYPSFTLEHTHYRNIIKKYFIKEYQEWLNKVPGRKRKEYKKRAPKKESLTTQKLNEKPSSNTNQTTITEEKNFSQMDPVEELAKAVEISKQNQS